MLSISGVVNLYNVPVDSGSLVDFSSLNPGLSYYHKHKMRLLIDIVEFQTDRDVVPLTANVVFDAHSIATSLPRIESWLEQCKADHPQCQSYHTSFMPSRILKIGGLDCEEIFLTQPTISTSYIALSYCWGKAQFLKLTSGNVQACIDGISVHDLPNIFQYALQVCRGLNFQYIWIDALCILQDDPQDWEIEASKMADVYRNSVLTLAMTKASSPDSIWCGETRCTTVDSINARLMYHLPDPGYETSAAFPLGQRGWAFQERLLGPRVLHFGPHELTWECSMVAVCECARKGAFLPSKRTFQEALCPQKNLARSEEIASLWRTLVERYSALDFTFESDRLPALSGIVAAMQSSHSGVYLAGLWSDTLIFDMLWYVDDDETGKKPSSDYTLVSPSWSWASVAAAVLYSVPKSSFYKTKVECQIEAFHCEPAGLSSTGRLESGWVRLRSSLLNCRSSTVGATTKFRIYHIDGEDAEESAFVPWEANLCFNKIETPGSDFLMVRMATWESSKHTEEQALIIRPVEGLKGHFQRIGVAVRGVSHPRLPWPDQLSVITIV